MTKNKTLKILTAVFTLTGSVITNALPVEQLHSTISIHIDRSGDQVRFTRCDKESTAPCTQIGAKAHYSVAELKKQGAKEYRQIYYSVAGDALMGLGMFFGVSEAIGGGILAEVSTQTAVTAGAAATGVETTALVKCTDAFNPSTQYDQYRITEDDVLNNDVVVVKDIEKSISALEDVLEKL